MAVFRLKRALATFCHGNVFFYLPIKQVGHDPCRVMVCNQETDSVKLMHQTFKSSHDFAPHNLRFKGRIKEGSLDTQDRIRWARIDINKTLSMVTKRIRLDASPKRRLRPAAS